MSSELAWQIGETAHLLRRHFDRRAAEAGITRAQWRVLAVLRRNPGSKQVAVADRLDIEPITLCRIVDRLEEAGMVERMRDPADRRAWRLELTGKAETLLGELGAVANEVAATAFDGLTPQERDQLEGLLARVRGNLAAAAEEEGRRSA